MKRIDTRRYQDDPVHYLARRVIAGSTINPETGCWEFQGALNLHGYAEVRMRRLGKPRFTINGHRAVFMALFGHLPRELQVCHTCDNRACVNPLHLFPGTTGENTADRDAKNRQYRPVGERNKQAKLTEAQVLEIVRRLQHEPNGQVARAFGVSRSTISDIHYGRTWGHVTGTQMVALGVPIEGRAAQMVEHRYIAIKTPTDMAHEYMGDHAAVYFALVEARNMADIAMGNYRHFEGDYSATKDALNAFGNAVHLLAEALEQARVNGWGP